MYIISKNLSDLVNTHTSTYILMSANFFSPIALPPPLNFPVVSFYLKVFLFSCRFDLGKAVGIKLTVTVFTAIESQVIAEKAGFETVYEADYADYKDKDGNSLFQGIKPKSAKLMAVRIE